MCGIWGIVDPNNKLNPIEKYYLSRSLASFNEARGKDSAGFAWVSTDGKKNVHKCEGLARNLDFDLIKDSPLIIGHTRLGTIGEKTINQAHPFHYRQHILTHNGMGSIGHDENKWAHGPSGVDSETMLRYIVATGGFTKDNMKSFAESWGNANWAFGVILPNNTFFSARNNNPFKYTVIKDNVLIYSSDEDHLKTSLIILGIPYDKVETYDEKEMLTMNEHGVNIEPYRTSLYSSYTNTNSSYGNYGNGKLWKDGGKYGKGNSKTDHNSY